MTLREQAEKDRDMECAACNTYESVIEGMESRIETLEAELESANHDYSELMKERTDYVAENKRTRYALEKIRDGEWDEECETKTGLREAYQYVPRSLIEQALKET